MKIDELGLSARAYHVLQNAKINTVEQLREALSNPFVKVGSIGSSVLNELQEKIAAHTITNGDRIRAMSDEELAEWVVFQTGYRESAFSEMTYLNILTGNNDNRNYAEKAMLTWLKQPVKEET